MSKNIITRAKKKFTAIVTKARSIQLIFSRNLNPVVGGRKTSSTSSNVSTVSGFFFAGIYTVLEILRAENERLYRSKNFVYRVWLTSHFVKDKTQSKKQIKQQEAAELKRILKLTETQLKTEAIDKIKACEGLEDILQEYAQNEGYQFELKEASNDEKNQSGSAIQLIKNSNKKPEILPLNKPKIKLAAWEQKLADKIEKFKRSGFNKHVFIPIWDALLLFATLFWLLATVISIVNIAAVLLGLGSISVAMPIIFGVAGILPIINLLSQWGRDLYYKVSGKKSEQVEEISEEVKARDALEIQLFKLAIIYKNFYLKHRAKLDKYKQEKKNALIKLKEVVNQDLATLLDIDYSVPELKKKAIDINIIKTKIKGNSTQKLSFAAIIAFINGYVDAIFIILPFTSLASFFFGTSIFSIPGLIIGSVLFTLIVGTVYADNAVEKVTKLQFKHKRMIQENENTLKSINNKLAERVALRDKIKDLKKALTTKLAACNRLLNQQSKAVLTKKVWLRDYEFPDYNDEPFFKRLDLKYKAKAWTFVDLIKMAIGDTSNGLFIAKGLLTTGIITLVIASPATFFSTAFIYSFAGVFAALWVGFKIIDYFKDRQDQYGKLCLQEIKLREQTLAYDLEAEKSYYQELKANLECLTALKTELQNQAPAREDKSYFFSLFSNNKGERLLDHNPTVALNATDFV